jgi:hypothetical protein
MNRSSEKHRFFKMQIKNTNNGKSEVRFKQLIRVVIRWCVHNRPFQRQIKKNTRYIPLVPRERSTWKDLVKLNKVLETNQIFEIFVIPL